MRGLLQPIRPQRQPIPFLDVGVGGRVANTLALGLLCEATGKGLPVLVLPYLNAAQGEYPVFGEGLSGFAASVSGCCSAPMCCRCIVLARASATSSPGISPSAPLWRLPSTSCGDYRARRSSSATCSLEVPLPLEGRRAGTMRVAREVALRSRQGKMTRCFEKGGNNRWRPAWE
jgi:hypothetical protein